jgi:hypothetical protein
VTLVKSGRCSPANISECLNPTKNFIEAEASLLRADNHNIRAVNHALNAKNWYFPSKEMFETLDKTWFSTVKDETKLKHVEQLREAIANLNPKVFLQVDRTCQVKALRTGQQIKCPESHPVRLLPMT